MQRILIASVLLAGAASQVGCATIFTGTSSEVRIDSDPAGATCAVIGGRGIGGLLVTASQVNVAMRKVLEMIGRHSGPEAQAKLEKVDFNELVAALISKSRLEKYSAAEISAAASVIESLPIPLVKDILEKLGIEEIGVTPMEVKLKKGSPWGVLCFKQGYKARIELIGVRFNIVTIFNFLNFFIGVPIDILTGAILNLEDRVKVRLRPQG